MSRGLRIILIVCLILASARSLVRADDNMDRIRAVESMAYFVESRFPAVTIHREAMARREDHPLKEPIDFSLISTTVNPLLVEEGRSGGCLWMHRSARKIGERWSGFSGILSKDRIVFFDDVADLVARFDSKEDMAILRTEDLEALVLKGVRNLENAAILSPLEVRLEYMDQIVVSLVLLKELRGLIEIDGAEAVLKSAKFKTLKVLLEALLARHSGLSDKDAFEMIPQVALPFARRALNILQRSMNPIRREDLEIIRQIQTSFRSV